MSLYQRNKGKRGEQDDKAIAQLAAYPFPTPNYEDIATTTQMTVLVSTRAFCEPWQSAPAFQNGNIPTRYFRFDAINALDLTHPGGPDTAMTVADSEKPRDTNVYLRGDRNKKGPGQGDDRFADVLQSLKDTGYDGWVAMEPFIYEPDGPGCAARMIGYVQGVLEGLK